jgi:N-acetylmuramoyl-L-alanine amidase
MSVESDNGAATAGGEGGHVVQQGESIRSITAAAGLHWETVWNHPKNQQLRWARKDPNVLLPGDRVFVPDLEIREESGQTEQRHKFRVKGTRVMLDLVLKDQDKPRADEHYTLTLDDGTTFSGTTDGNGGIRRRIPVRAKSGVLIVGPTDDRYELKLSHIDPIDALSGVQGRLNNLGFWCGEPDGTMNSRTQAAIQSFQKKHGLEISGQVDQATRDKLKQEYGS